MDRFFSRHRLYFSDTMAHIYPDSPMKQSEDQAGPSTTSSEPRHKEEGKKRREMDVDVQNVSPTDKSVSTPLQHRQW